MITIQELIPELDPLKNEIKVHFAFSPRNKKEPLNEFLKNNFKTWQEHQTKKNFEKRFILSLIYYKQNEWLFAGVYERIGVQQINKNYFEYDTKLLNIKEDLIGRLIVGFSKPFRASYLYYSKYNLNLSVSQIFKNRITTEPFPGYENVIVDYDDLKTVYNNNSESWSSALKSVFGVYLIADKKTGKMYVGSASGEESIWNRWRIYIGNGHGENVKLKNLVESEGKDYLKYYQFSILEIFSKITSKDEIIKRETHWKKKLLSREFGYNEN